MFGKLTHNSALVPKPVSCRYVNNKISIRSSTIFHPSSFRNMSQNVKPTAKSGNPLEQYDIMGPTVGKNIIEGYSPNGFTVGGVFYEGSIIVFPKRILMWNVKSYKDITSQSLAAIHLLLPKTRILILGCGARIQFPTPDVSEAFYKKGMSIEPMDSRRALSTFNFLNAEDRDVAVALLPVNVQ